MVTPNDLTSLLDDLPSLSFNPRAFSTASTVHVVAPGTSDLEAGDKMMHYLQFDHAAMASLTSKVSTAPSTPPRSPSYTALDDLYRSSNLPSTTSAQSESQNQQFGGPSAPYSAATLPPTPTSPTLALPILETAAAPSAHATPARTLALSPLPVPCTDPTALAQALKHLHEFKTMLCRCPGNGPASAKVPVLELHRVVLELGAMLADVTAVHGPDAWIPVDLPVDAAARAHQGSAELADVHGAERAIDAVQAHAGAHHVPDMVAEPAESHAPATCAKTPAVCLTTPAGADAHLDLDAAINDQAQGLDACALVPEPGAVTPATGQTHARAHRSGMAANAGRATGATADAPTPSSSGSVPMAAAHDPSAAAGIVSGATMCQDVAVLQAANKKEPGYTCPPTFSNVGTNGAVQVKIDLYAHEVTSASEKKQKQKKNSDCKGSDAVAGQSNQQVLQDGQAQEQTALDNRARQGQASLGPESVTHVVSKTLKPTHETRIVMPIVLDLTPSPGSEESATPRQQKLKVEALLVPPTLVKECQQHYKLASMDDSRAFGCLAEYVDTKAADHLPNARFAVKGIWSGMVNPENPVISIDLRERLEAGWSGFAVKLGAGYRLMVRLDDRIVVQGIPKVSRVYSSRQSRGDRPNKKRKNESTDTPDASRPPKVAKTM